MKTRRTSLTRDITRIIVGDQYQHNWAITQIQWNRCHCGYSRLIYEDDMTKDNTNKHLLRRNSQNLQK